MEASEKTSSDKTKTLNSRFIQTRALSEDFCKPLEIEDYGLQCVADTSPAKWHLAHTSWFFETFLLKPFEKGFKHYNPKFEFLFNSYYNGVGEQFLRPNRGLLSRPTVKEVYQYRKNITERINDLLAQTHPESVKIIELVELGINHEQQHQELFFTDLLFNWYQNPLLPQYQELKSAQLVKRSKPVAWLAQQEQMVSLGTDASDNQFIFDNESPKHQTYLNAFEIQNRLVTNQEYIEFIENGGYSRPEFWLSDGWAAVQKHNWQAPLYWKKQENTWLQYGLNGLQALELTAPVCHISGYEADAYARWAGARLPTEAEWETIAKQAPSNEGNFVENGLLRPVASNTHQFFGDVWEWTASSYTAYPGFKAAKGAVGEYNGKFMCNQLVLRGGSCVTSRSHIRSTYRNFFYPDARWQFSGLRLARDI